MVVKLAELADVTLGTILTRVNAEQHDDAESVETISMQEVSYFTGKSKVIPEKLYSKIKSSKIESCEFTKENDVLLGLTSGNAMVIDCSRENKLVLSNFLKIRIHDTNVLNPKYLCWLINDNKYIKNYFESAKQGVSAVSVIKANDVKEMPIELLPIEKQIDIGKLYYLYLEKYKIEGRMTELSFSLNKFLANNYYEGAIKNEDK